MPSKAHLGLGPGYSSGYLMEISRIIDLKNLLGEKSFFLFGPRATGKSTLVRRQLSGSITLSRREPAAMTWSCFADS